MSYRNIALFLLLLVGFLPFNAAAQDKNDWQRQQEENQRLEELQRANREGLENLNAVRGSQFIDIDFFLPDAKDAWTVSISAHGGFAGGNRLIAAINSNGNYLCHPRGFNAAQNIVPATIFAEISNLVNREKFIYNAQAVYQEPAIPFCSDCSVEILTITRKSKKTIIKDQYSVNTLAQSAPKLYEIYEKVANSAACR